MRDKSLWVVVIISVLLILSAGAAGALPGHLLAPEAPQVAGKINYQGRLTDPVGGPLSGTFDMRFRLYDDPAAGTLLWDSGSLPVTVSQGLFNVGLTPPTSYFDGRALWLSLTVGGELLTPRQELNAAPYALSLKPGAKIWGSPSAATGGAIDVVMTDYQPQASAVRGYVSTTGTAIYGDSRNGAGVFGHSHQTYGVQGSSFWGWGGYFHSQTGNGVVVETGGIDTWDHAGTFRAAMGNAVYAVSTGNAAVRAESGSGAAGLARPGGAVGVVGLGAMHGVWGSGDAGKGVYGVSRSSDGVYGEASGDLGTAAGVKGQIWSGDGYAVYGVKYGAFGNALRADEHGSGNALAALSDNGFGLWSSTGSADNNYGLYTPDNIFSLNYQMSGALMRVVQNASADVLETGDVVALTGISAPLNDGDAPVIQVSQITTANSTAVAGVVYSAFNVRAVDGSWQSTGEGRKPGEEVVLPGPVAAGGYLLMVTQGPALVNVDAAAGPLQTGDLLSTASTAGYAGRAAEVAVEGQAMALPGTVFGKALEPLSAGQKQIYVYVTLQ